MLAPATAQLAPHALMARELWQASKPVLLDLRLFELDVLAHHRVILLEDDLFRRRAGVLLGDVEETRAGGRQQLNLLGDRLSHGENAPERVNLNEETAP